MIAYGITTVVLQFSVLLYAGFQCIFKEFLLGNVT